MYKVEFCLLLWPLDLLSFDALLYFYDNKYVVILILILILIHMALRYHQSNSWLVPVVL